MFFLLFFLFFLFTFCLFFSVLFFRFLFLVLVRVLVPVLVLVLVHVHVHVQKSHFFFFQFLFYFSSSFFLFLFFVLVELIPAPVNSGCAVDRHSQRAAWCPGRVFSSSCSLHTNAPVFESNGLITTLKIMVGHKCTHADMSTRQVDTLQLQLTATEFL